MGNGSDERAPVAWKKLPRSVIGQRLSVPTRQVIAKISGSIKAEEGWEPSYDTLLYAMGLRTLRGNLRDLIDEIRAIEADTYSPRPPHEPGS